MFMAKFYFKKNVLKVLNEQKAIIQIVLFKSLSFLKSS